MKNKNTSEYYNKPIKEEFSKLNNNIPEKNNTIIRISDTFDDLLLYFITGLLIIYIIDYTYKLGKKSY